MQLLSKNTKEEGLWGSSRQPDCGTSTATIIKGATKGNTSCASHTVSVQLLDRVDLRAYERGKWVQIRQSSASKPEC